MQNESELEEFFSNSLGCKILVSLTNEELDEAELSGGEQQILLSMKHESRRSSWLRGRQALRGLLTRLNVVMQSGISYDSSLLIMPNPILSLSHSGDFAIAVARLSGTGIGVDLESPRIVRDGATRFFLAAASESEWYSSIEQSMRTDELLRLWTTKESLFKADLSNKDKTLNCFRVSEPRLHCGRATFVDHCDEKFQYSSTKFGDYWLTVSIAGD